MSDLVRISQLSALDVVDLSANYFVVLDVADTTQSAEGSTKKVSGETLSDAIWGLSSLYISNDTTVNTNSANWQNTFTTVNTNSAAWGTGGGGSGTGLSIFAEVSSTSSPNNVVPTHALSANSSSTNVDVALIVKGTGAILAQIPTGTVAGGNKRGSYATDWQRQRSAVDQVASGSYSTIGGGYNNTASGTYATVAGGNFLRATNTGASIGGGYNAAVTAQFGTIGGGEGCVAASEYSVIGGGFQNTTNNTGSHAVIGGGGYNVTNDSYGTIAGGSSNSTTVYGAVGGGSSNVIAGITHNTIAGGWYNQVGALGFCNAVGGGLRNVANSLYDFIGGGYDNTISIGNSTTIGGGNTNTASGNYSTIAGGTTNNVSSLGAFIGGGYNNVANNEYTVVGGGVNNVASGQYSYIGGGADGNATRYGQYTHASGTFSTVGASQFIRVVQRAATNGTTPVILTADGAATYFGLPSDTAYSLNIKILGINSTGADIAEYNKRVIVKNISGTSSLVRSDDINPDYETNASTAAVITVDNASDTLRITVTGITGESWRWVAVIDGIEMKSSG